MSIQFLHLSHYEDKLILNPATICLYKKDKKKAGCQIFTIESGKLKEVTVREEFDVLHQMIEATAASRDFLVLGELGSIFRNLGKAYAERAIQEATPIGINFNYVARMEARQQRESEKNYSIIHLTTDLLYDREIVVRETPEMMEALLSSPKTPQGSAPLPPRPTAG